MRDDMVNSIRAANQAMEAELRELADRVEELRTKYDRYFMGLDRFPPERFRSKLERDMRNSKLLKSHKTELKFRFMNVQSRFTAYRRYWDRVMRMIEEGRFKREKNALGKMGGLGQPKDEPTSAPDAARSVFDSWVEAQGQVGRAANVDFDAFKSKLEAQKAKQMEKHGWKDVSYSVKVKDGKVALVAKPVKE